MKTFPKVRSIHACAVLLIAAIFSSPVWAAPMHPRKGISHTYPEKYEDWEDAFPAGNGKMGIMVFGNPLNETVIYNNRGFNLAKTRDRTFNEVPQETREKIKQLCAEEKFQQANQLAVESSGWQGGGEGNRHPGFKMTIHIPEDGEISNYGRECDFETGEIFVKWTDNRGKWIRKSFVSRKDNVIVQEIAAPEKAKLICTIKLSIDPAMFFPEGMKFTSSCTDSFLTMKAIYPDGTNNAGYEGVTYYKITGGRHTIDNHVLKVVDADSVLLLTRTKRYDSQCEQHFQRNLLQKELLGIKSDYALLLSGQKATYGTIYNRVVLDLGATDQQRSLSNEALLAMQKDSGKSVTALWERVFDAGRCYYLSSSSERTPPDLLGIWTGDCNAGWGGYYHLDANLNLQVSGGNIGNMPEAMEGYFNLLETWKDDFRINARKLLGCRGLLSCGNSPGLSSGLMANINDYYPYHYKTGEMAWLLYSFWEHYLISGDVDFLRQRLYPMLREMGDFYDDFLTLKDADGHSIFAGSISPENQPVNVRASLLNNSNYDIAGARFILTSLIEAVRILDIDEGADKWTGMLKKLPPYRINDDGALQEWAWPGLQDNYGHRHSSRLMMIWPYRAITPENNPILFEAARQTLLKKDEHQYEDAGHGLLHAALIAAGLKNADSVNDKLLRLTREGFYYNSLASAHYVDGKVFCTDVCHSVPTIMMEMLVASSPGVLELLPAVPEGLKTGTLKGVKGRNRLTVEKMSWDLTQNTIKCTLKSDIDQPIVLIQRSGIETISTSARVFDSPLGPIGRVMQLPKGQSVTVYLTINRSGQK